MGISASRRARAASNKDIEDPAVASGANELWVTVRAKTTDKRTREVTTKRWGFKASRAGVTIGSDPGASICIDDASLSGEHAQICLTDSGDVGVVTLGRTYLLIGQGDRSAGPVPLAKDTVMKLGACSLQVSETCALRGVVSGGAGGPPPTQPRRRPSRADVACYICFEETEEDPVGNPLVTQPCACAKRVHRGCLARWISARGSRLCSICKARLPIDFTVEPPYIVVQVVRHMRGLSWAGEREYIVSFVHRPTGSIIVGSGAECDLVLPDPSLSRTHSRISFRPHSQPQPPQPGSGRSLTTQLAAAPLPGGTFYLEDLQSSTGSYLKLDPARPHILTPMETTASQFKLGRTMLAIKVKRRKPGLLSDPWALLGGTGAAAGGAGYPAPPSLLPTAEPASADPCYGMAPPLPTASVGGNVLIATAVAPPLPGSDAAAGSTPARPLHGTVAPPGSFTPATPSTPLLQAPDEQSGGGSHLRPSPPKTPRRPASAAAGIPVYSLTAAALSPAGGGGAAGATSTDGLADSGRTATVSVASPRSAGGAATAASPRTINVRSAAGGGGSLLAGGTASPAAGGGSGGGAASRADSPRLALQAAQSLRASHSASALLHSAATHDGGAAAGAGEGSEAARLHEQQQQAAAAAAQESQDVLLALALQAQEEAEAVAAGALPAGSSYHRHAYFTAQAEAAARFGPGQYGAGPAAPLPAQSTPAAAPARRWGGGGGARPDGAGGVILEGYAALAAAGMLDDADEEEEGEGSDEEGGMGGGRGDGGGTAALDAWEAMDPASLREIADRLAAEMVAARDQRLRALGLPSPASLGGAGGPPPAAGAGNGGGGGAGLRRGISDGSMGVSMGGGDTPLASPGGGRGGSSSPAAAAAAGLGLRRAPSTFSAGAGGAAPAPAPAAGSDAVPTQQHHHNYRI